MCNTNTDWYVSSVERNMQICNIYTSKSNMDLYIYFDNEDFILCCFITYCDERSIPFEFFNPNV